MSQAPDPESLLPSIEERLQSAGYAIEEEARRRLATHLALLLKWSERTSLTTIRSIPDAIERHILESVAAAAWIAPGPGPLLDIGSGNGYPGIPMKCLHPDMATILLEPSLRKSVFLAHVIRTLQLTGIEVRRERVELATELQRYAPLQVITLRAVAAVAAVIEGSASALSEGGRTILLLGEDSARSATRAARDHLVLLHDAPLPWRRTSRLLVLEKRSS